MNETFEVRFTGSDQVVQIATIKNAAKIIGIPLSSMYYHLSNGDVEARYIGPHAYVVVEDARAILAVKHRPKKLKPVAKQPRKSFWKFVHLK